MPSPTEGWEPPATMKGLISLADQSDLSSEQVDEALDSSDPREALVRLLRSPPGEYEDGPTKAFVRALSQAGQGPHALEQALQILQEAPGNVNPDVLVPFKQHQSAAILHATRVHLYAAGNDMRSADSKASLSLIRELLNQGADPNSMDYVCFPPLLYAVHAKSLRLTKLLIEHGARCDAEPLTLYLALHIDERIVVNTMGKMYEKVRLGMKELNNPGYWPAGFARLPFVGFPTREIMGEGLAFEEYSSLFDRATSGSELLQSFTREGRNGVQPWTVALLDLLLGSGTCNATLNFQDRK